MFNFTHNLQKLMRSFRITFLKYIAVTHCTEQMLTNAGAYTHKHQIFKLSRSAIGAQAQNLLLTQALHPFSKDGISRGEQYIVDEIFPFSESHQLHEVL